MKKYGNNGIVSPDEIKGALLEGQHVHWNGRSVRKSAGPGWVIQVGVRIAIVHDVDEAIQIAEGDEAAAFVARNGYDL